MSTWNSSGLPEFPVRLPLRRLRLLISLTDGMNFNAESDSTNNIDTNRFLLPRKEEQHAEDSPKPNM